MMSKKKCPVCDMEEVTDAVSVTGGEEVICGSCATSYKSLMAELQYKTGGGDGGRADGELPAAEQVAEIPPATVSARRISPSWLALGAVLLVGVILFAGWAVRSGESAESVVAGYEQAQGAKGAPAAAKQAGKAAHAEPGQASPQPAGEVADEELAQEEEEDEATAQADFATAKERAAAARAAAASGQAAGASAGSYTVQVSSHGSASEAESRVGALAAKGFEAGVAAAEVPGKGTWYRVQSGRFPTREEASAYARRLQASGAASSTLVTQAQN